MAAEAPPIASPKTGLPPPREPETSTAEQGATELIKHLQLRLGAQSSALEKARVHAEIGRIYEIELRDLKRASSHYQKAIELAPDLLAALQGARRTYVALGQTRALPNIYDAELRVTKRPRHRASLLYRKGLVLESLSQDQTAALQAFRDAAQLTPFDPTIQKAVERCERKASAWPGLSKTQERLAELLKADSELSAAIICERARLAEVRETNPRKAVQLYLAAFDRHSGNVAARRALRRLLPGSGEWNALHRVLVAEASAQVDAPAQAQIWRDIAELQSDRLGNYDEAIAALEEAANLEPSSLVTLRRLVSAYRHVDHPAAAVDAGARLFALSDNPNERTSVAVHLADVLSKIEDRETEATTWLERAAELDPQMESARTALELAYTRSENWEGLRNLLTRAAESSTDNLLRADLYSRLASLLEVRLGRVDEAIAHLRKALTYVANYAPAIQDLVRLLNETSRWTTLIELYESLVDIESDMVATTSYLLRIGAIYEDNLNQPTSALRAYQQALELEPSNRVVLQAVQRTSARAKKWPVLTASLEQEALLTAGQPRAGLLKLRAALIHFEELDDVQAGIRLADEVRQNDPDHRGMLELLARMYEAEGRWNELQSVLERLAELAPSTERARSLYRIAELAETRRGRASEALQFYQQCLQLDPKHDLAFEAIVRIVSQTQDWSALERELQTKTKSETDPQQRAQRAVALGRVREGHLNDNAGALAAYRQALSAAPNYPPALDACRRLLTANEDWRGLRALVEDEAKAATQAPEKMAAQLEKADISEARLEQRNAAETTLLEVLKEDVTVEALLRLEALLLSRNASKELIDVYQWLYAKSGTAETKAVALREVARLLDGEAERVSGDGNAGAGQASDSDEPPRGADVYAALLEHVPDDIEGLEGLRRFALDNGDVAQAAELEDRLAQHHDDVTQKVFYLHHRALRLESSDAHAALESYRLILTLDPKNAAAVRGLSRAAKASGDVDALRDAAAREATIIGEVTHATELLRHAATAAREAGDLDAATRDLEAALDHQPDNTDVAWELKELLVESGDLQRLVQRFRRAATRAPAEVAARLHLELAKVHAERLQNLPSALGDVKNALKADASNVDAIALMAEYYERNRQWKEALEALQRLLGATRDAERLTNAHIRCAILNEEHLGDKEAALQSLQQALRLSPDNQVALIRQARVEAELGHGAKAMTAVQKLISLTTDHRARADLLVDLAAVQFATGEKHAAADSLLESVRTNGAEGRGLDAFEALMKSSPAVAKGESLAKALETHISATDSPDSAAVLRLADVYTRILQRPRQGIQALRAAVAQTPQNSEIWLALVRKIHSTESVDTAIVACEEFIAACTDDPDAYRELASLMRAQQDEVEAVNALLPVAALRASNEQEHAAIHARGRAPLPSSADLQVNGFWQAISVDGSLHHPTAGLVGAASDSWAKLWTFEPSHYGVSKRDRIAARSPHPLRQLADEIAATVGAGDFDLYVHNGSHADVTVEMSSPPAIMVPRWAESLSDNELTYLLARPLILIAQNVAPAGRLSVAELGAVISATLVSCTTLVLPVDPTLTAQVGKSISLWARRRVEGAAQACAATPIDYFAWAHAAQLSAALGAAILADDLVAAATFAARAEGLTTPTSGLSADLLRAWTTTSSRQLRHGLHGTAPKREFF